MLKALFVLGILIFFSRLLGYAEKRLDKKTNVNFKIYDAKNWIIHNCNTHITQYPRKQTQPDNEIWSVNRT